MNDPDPKPSGIRAAKRHAALTTITAMGSDLFAPALPKRGTKQCACGRTISGTKASCLRCAKDASHAAA